MVEEKAIRLRRVIVTGGCGFIGSALVRRLATISGCAILNIDKLTYASQPEAVADVARMSGYAFHRCDVCDTQQLATLIADFRPDTIFHLAAESHVDRSLDAPAEFVRTNVLGTLSVLEAATHYWSSLDAAEGDCFRLIHVSTDEVYGSLDLDSPRRFKIGDGYAPNSPYSASKAGADHLVRAFHRSYGLPAIISNCSNNYGPWQFPEKVIPTIILAGFTGNPMPVYGDGLHVRDWIHVEDHVEGLLTIALRGEPGGQYMAGGFGATSNLDLVRLLCQLLDEALPQSQHRPHDKLITFVSDRPGHDRRYDVDPGILHDVFGWRPSRTLEQGLRETLAWYLARREALELRQDASGLNRRGLAAFVTRNGG
jgi:dTDP-glucose 4,6-dehydratase